MHLVVVILAYTLAVRGGVGDRYGDYSAAGLPHYNMEYGSRGAAPIDEYPDRSPDAPAHLDYKYEEESGETVKTFPVKHIDDELYQKPKGKGWRSNKMTHIDEGEVDTRDTVVPKYKANRRFIKHRTRFKDNKTEKSNRRPINRSRDRNADIDDIDLDDRNDFEVSKRPHGDNIESDRFGIRHTTMRVPRRKPRDRTISQDTESRLRSDNLAEISKIRRVDDDSDDIESINRHPLKVIDINEASHSVKNKPNPKAYSDYEEYEGVDMKRINRLKNRLPELLRRTKASDPEPESTRRMEDFLYRRAFPSEELTSTATITTTMTTKTSISPVSVDALITQLAIKQNSNMSLAEKSRLSILKKVQRKESDRNTTTTKPPVLLQVTQKLQTVVMVERNPQQPQIRARQLFEDSPERLEKAKRLMRRKLVANAHSIHELTDNWDEMICDYIDVSLLDDNNNKSNSMYHSIHVILLSIIYNAVIGLNLLIKPMR